MKTLQVTILGREFSLKSEGSEEYIHQVADYVKQKIEAVQHNQTMDVISTVILTALNIADDYFQLKGERDSLINIIEDRSLSLANKIDSRLRHPVIEIKSIE
ncbi:MAG: cell division protein ZapA [Deltaproteobacteria bacterium]|nr:cell division protein ZapA [Deltaproteobacteria bacterium]